MIYNRLSPFLNKIIQLCYRVSSCYRNILNSVNETCKLATLYLFKNPYKDTFTCVRKVYPAIQQWYLNHWIHHLNINTRKYKMNSKNSDYHILVVMQSICSPHILEENTWVTNFPKVEKILLPFYTKCLSKSFRQNRIKKNR